jgi:hypothetical protein
MPNSWSRRLLIKERTGAKVDRPVHKVCGMMKRMNLRARGRAGAALLGLAILALGAGLALDSARAETIKNPIAVFAALDKVTGRISHLEIPINKTVEFGALKVTPRVCDTRPPTEAPDTASFVEVDEVKLTGEVQRIFTGWMFAESPGLHAVEHPVFDVWLTSCKTPGGATSSGNNAKAPPAAGTPAPAPAAAPAAPPPPPPPEEAAAPPDEPLPWTKPPPNAASSNR